jgi:hypothetical protein
LYHGIDAIIGVDAISPLADTIVLLVAPPAARNVVGSMCNVTDDIQEREAR